MPPRGANRCTEFADYRDYVVGDDVRYVDWNIFAAARTAVRQVVPDNEEEMHVVSIVDASSSMQFGGKFEKAKKLAAAFGLMGLMNVERVSSFVCNHAGREPLFLPPCTGRVNRRRLFDFLDEIEGAG